MKTPTAQTVLALPLRTGEDSEGDAYVIDSNDSRLFKAWFAGDAELAELIRIVNAHTELVEALRDCVVEMDKLKLPPTAQAAYIAGAALLTKFTGHL